MGTDERSDMKDAVQMSREESSFWKRYISGKAWFPLLALMVGIAVLLVLSIFMQDASIEICVKDAALTIRGLRSSPVLVVISFTCAAISLVLLYGIHCRFVRGIAYEDRKRAKDHEDFILQQTRESKSVILLPQAQRGQTIHKVEIDVRYHGDSTENVTGGK